MHACAAACGINIRRKVIQSNFVDPLCFQTIVVLLTCHLFKDSCIFVFNFFWNKIEIFFSLIHFLTDIRVVKTVVSLSLYKYFIPKKNGKILHSKNLLSICYEGQQLTII